VLYFYWNIFSLLLLLLSSFLIITLLSFGAVLLFNKLTLQFSEQSQYDPITQLPNRPYFFNYLNRVLENNESKAFGVMTIGIDRFPQINQALGYQVGDRLLNHVAQRLKSQLSEAQIIARLASNVFIVLIPGLNQKNYSEVVDKVMEVFSTPFSVYTVQIDLDVLVGMSFFPIDGIQAAPLIQKADLALYAARFSVERCEFYQENKE